MAECGDNCFLEQEFVVLKPEVIKVNFLDIVDPTYCASELDSLKGIHVEGGTGPYQYIVYNESDLFIEGGIIWEDIGYLNISSSGNYDINIFDVNGCSVEQPIVFEFSDSTDPFVIDYDIMNATGPNSEDGSIITHISGGYPPYEYNWVVGSGEIVNDSILAELNPDIYAVFVTDSVGCVVSEFFTVEVMTNVDELNLKNQLDLFPNPSSEIINLTFDESLKASNIQMSIINSYGQDVMRRKLVQNSTQLDISNLSDGIYFATFDIDGQSIVKRFVKY